MMNNYTFISVVVLTYNPIWIKLRNTLKSIINQKNVDFEIIISDDGSEQDYFDKVELFFKESNFKNYSLNKNTVNYGTVKNVLSALKIAKGKYIKLISPGDFFYDNNTLEAFVNFINNKPASFYFSNIFYYIKKEDNSIELFYDKKNPNNIKPWIKNNKKKIYRYYLLKGDFICGATTVFEKETLQKYLLELKEIIKYAEDFVLIYMIAKKEPGYYINIDKGIWYEYGSGISTNTNNKFSLIIQQEKRLVYEFLMNKGIIPSWIYNIHYLKNITKQRLLRFIFFPESFLFRFSKTIKGYKLFDYNISELKKILEE